MSEIDERVVSLQFENENFEEGAQRSIGTLNKLQAAMEFAGSAEGFNAIEKSIAGLDFSQVAESVSLVQERFSTLGIIGATVISNLTNQVTNLATSMLKSISVDQISSGFDKYTTKVESVQTIINATKTESETMAVAQERVTKSLEKLSEYTDQTSYKYTDMLANIGKFTATGQDLDQSIEAMEGIANWAAKSGVSIDSASNAMYAFSKAMGKGEMSTQYWMSIESLNMNTAEFNKTLLETAQEVGTVKGVMDEATNSMKYYTVEEDKVTSHEVDPNALRDSFTYGWMNTEVMMAVLKKYGDTSTDFGQAAYKAAQEAKTFKDALGAVQESVASYWSGTFEDIFGNYTQARVLWTDLCNAIIRETSKVGDARNEAFDVWHTEDYEDALSSIYTIWESLAQTANVVQTKFGEAFDDFDLYEDVLHKITEGLNEWAVGMKILDKKIDVFSNDGEGLVTDTLSQCLYFENYMNKDFLKNLESNAEDAAAAMHTLFGKEGAFGDIFEMIGSGGTAAFKVFGDTFRTVVEAISGRDISSNWDYIRLLVDGLTKVTDKFKEFTSTVAPKVSKFFEDLTSDDNLGPWLDSIGNVVSTFKNTFSVVLQLIKPVWDIFTGLVNTAFTHFPEVFGKIGEVFKFITGLLKSFSESVKSVMNGEFKFSDIFDGFGDAIEGFLTRIKNLSVVKAFGRLFDLIKQIPDVLSGGIKNPDFYGNLFKTVGAVLSGVGIKNMFNWFVKSDTVDRSGIGIVLEGVEGSFKSINKILGDIKDSFGTFLEYMDENILTNVIANMKAFAFAIIEIAIALLIVSSIPVDQMQNATASLVIIVAMMFFMMKALTTMVGKTNGGAEGSGVLSQIPSMLLGMFEMPAKWLALASLLFAFGTAMVEVALAMKIIGSMDAESFTQGVEGFAIIFAGIIGMLAVILKLTSNSKITSGLTKNFQAGTIRSLIGLMGGLIAFMFSLTICVAALTALAHWDQTAILTAAGIIAAFLVIVGIIAMKFSSIDPKIFKTSKMTALAGLFVAIAAAIDMMAIAIGALAIIGKLAGIDALIAGAAVIAVMMYAVVGVLAILNQIGGKDGVNLGKIAVCTACFAAIVGAMNALIPLIAAVTAVFAAAGSIAGGFAILGGVAALFLVVAGIVAGFLAISAVIGTKGGGMALAGMAVATLCFAAIAAALNNLIPVVAEIGVLASMGIGGATMGTMALFLIEVLTFVGLFMAAFAALGMSGMGWVGIAGMAVGVVLFAIMAAAMNELIPLIAACAAVSALSSETHDIRGETLGMISRLLWALIPIIAVLGIISPLALPGLISIAAIAAIGKAMEALIPIIAACAGISELGVEIKNETLGMISRLLWGLIPIIAVMGAMSGLGALSIISSVAIAALGAALLSFVVCLSAITAADVLSDGASAKAVSVLYFLIMAVAQCLAVLGAMAGFAVGTIVAAVAIAALGAALLVLAPAMLAICNLPEGSSAKLVGFTVALIAILTILGLFGTIGAQILAGVILVAVALSLFAVAVGLLAVALLLVEGVIKAFVGLGELLGLAAEEVGEGVREFIVLLGEILGDVVAGIVEALGAAAIPILDACMVVINDVLLWIANNAGPLLAVCVGVIYDVAAAIVNAIMVCIPLIEAAVGKVIQACGDVIIGIVDLIGGMIAEQFGAGDQWAAWMDSTFGQWDNGFDSFVGRKMEEATDKMENLDVEPKATKTAVDMYYGELEDSVDDGTAEVVDAADTGNDAISNAMANMTNVDTAGISNEIVDSMDLMSLIPQEVVDSCADAGVDLESELSSAFSSSGDGATEAAASTGSAVGTAAGDAATETATSGMSAAADYATQGFVGKIFGSLGLFSGAGSASAGSFLSAFMGVLGIASPSKVMKQMGGYTIDGFVVGLNNMSKEVSKSAEDIGDNTVQSLKDGLSGIDSIDTQITDPVVKPVLDLSEIQNGSTTIDAMLSRTKALRVGGTFNMAESSTEKITKSNNELISAVNKIYRSVSNGSDLYLDDGRIAGRIDRRLGRKT